MGKIPYEATSVIVEQLHSLIQSHVEDLEDTITEQIEELKQADFRIKELESQLAKSQELVKQKETNIMLLETDLLKFENDMDLV